MTFTSQTAAIRKPVFPSDGFPQMAETQKGQLRLERFVIEYLKDFNGAAAYRRSGSPGALTTTAANAASKWLTRPQVRAEIDRRSQGRITLADVTADRIAIEMARIAFYDPRKLVKQKEWTLDNGEVVKGEVAKDLLEIDDDTARAIGAVDFKSTGRVIKMSDKQSALMGLAKLKGLIVDRRVVAGVQIAGAGDAAIEGDLDVVEMALGDGDVGEMIEEIDLDALADENNDDDDQAPITNDDELV